MMRSIWLKTLHDQWRWLGGLAILSGLLAAMYVALYPSIGGIKELQRFLDQLPDSFRALMANQSLDLSTPEGFLNVELFTFVAPLFVMVYGAAVGSSATAGEEERGTADLLLANPIPRFRVVLEKAFTMLLGLVIICVVLWIGVAVAAPLVNVQVGLGRVAQALVSVALLGLATGGIALLVGAATGRRTMALGVALALAVLSFFLNGLGSMVDWLDPWRPASIFYHYIGNDPLRNGLDPLHAGVLLGVALVAIALAAFSFQQRDLRS